MNAPSITASDLRKLEDTFFPYFALQRRTMFGESYEKSTARDSMDQDYRTLIVRDACVDSDPDLHVCLLDRLVAKRTDVVTATEFARATQLDKQQAL